MVFFFHRHILHTQALKLYEVYGDDLQELENWQQTSNIDQLIQDSEDEVVDILDQIVRGLNVDPAEEDAITDLTAAVQVRTCIAVLETTLVEIAAAAKTTTVETQNNVQRFNSIAAGGAGRGRRRHFRRPHRRL